MVLHIHGEPTEVGQDEDPNLRGLKKVGVRSDVRRLGDVLVGFLGR